MLQRSRTLPAALAAVAILFVAAGHASAGRLSLNSGTFRIVWAPMNFMSRTGTTIRCNVTLGGTFASRTFAKVAGAQIGSITEARIESCSGGTMVLLTETLPWSLFYRSFVGTLPNIEQMVTHMTGFRVRWAGFFSSCLYRVVAEAPQEISFVRNRETRQFILANLIDRFITSDECPGQEIRLSGSGGTTVREGSEGIFLSLI